VPSPRGARRYAQAVFELAQEQGRLDEWSRDLAGLAYAWLNELIALIDIHRAGQQWAA